METLFAQQTTSSKSKIIHGCDKTTSKMLAQENYEHTIYVSKS